MLRSRLYSGQLGTSRAGSSAYSLNKRARIKSRAGLCDDSLAGGTLPLVDPRRRDGARRTFDASSAPARETARSHWGWAGLASRDDHHFRLHLRLRLSWLRSPRPGREGRHLCCRPSRFTRFVTAPSIPLEGEDPREGP